MARRVPGLTALLATAVVVAGCASHDARSSPPSPPSTSASTATSGTASPGPVTVVGLGDSVMSGTNCGCAGITAEYATAVHRQTGAAVTPVGLGAAGAVTGDLAADLRAGRTRQAVAAA